MAKNVKEVEEMTSEKVENTTTKNAKNIADKKAKNVKKSNKVKKENKVGRKTKEVFGELKKVTWPSFGKVMKKTFAVIGVVLFFAVSLLLIDLGLGYLHGILVNGIPTV